jgi:hypothetical protein
MIRTLLNIITKFCLLACICFEYPIEITLTYFMLYSIPLVRCKKLVKIHVWATCCLVIIGYIYTYI